MDKSKPILVTGATGYVGGRLVPKLLENGYKIRATSRSIEKLQSRSWATNPNVEIVSLDVFDRDSLIKAASGCSVAYYLVHSMDASSKDFARSDRIAAEHMVSVAEEANLERIIYLGGLGEEGKNLSKHLKSRTEVAEILKSGKVPTTVLRAAMIIGSGSVSFEILRYLVDRLPLMITPKWVHVKNQPIAIRNVLDYLTGCLENEETKGKSFDIGGSEVLTYKELMETYAEEAGIGKRFIIPVPVFTPKLSSYWIHLITPIPSYIARPLAEGLRNPVVCRENEIQKIIPQKLLNCREAIKLALNNLENQSVETHWADAGVVKHPEWITSSDPKWSGGTIFEDKRSITLEGSPKELWEPIINIGGDTGYYYGNWLWALRGLLDKLFGGVGLRRGRRDKNVLRPGDVLDFWRVIKVNDYSDLLLIAEMKLPGTAILGFKLNKIDENKTEIIQIARFQPKGLLGLAYWYLVMPLHNLVFNGMLEGIGRSTSKNILAKPIKT